MLVSSANMVHLDISFIMAGKSLMYRRKNNGPRIDCCGTPCFTFPHSEKQFLEYLFFINTL